MTVPITHLAIAFPKAEADRHRLRVKHPTSPLPDLHDNGVEAPCFRCGMVLDIGPRLVRSLLAGSSACCPDCMHALVNAATATGNIGVVLNRLDTETPEH